MRLHLMDGTFELFRAFYGAPSFVNSDGVEAGATRVFMRGLYNLLQQDDVTHVGVAFDTTIESFRNQLFDGYKTGEGIDPELWGQSPWMEKAASALGVVVWSMVKYEADDALAAAAHRFSKSKQVDQVVICSPDKDLYQVVDGKKVIVWDRIRDLVWDEKGVEKKLGVPPKSVPDYLALVGDTADGIPGVPGWGAKSTATVLGKYKTVDAIPTDPEDWSVKVRGAKRLSENLNELGEEVHLYKKLATLRVDVPLKESLSDLKWRGVDLKKVRAVCKFTNDSRLLERIEKDEK